MNHSERKVSVAEYRRAYDHAYRIANVDYHSCVNQDELKSWVVRAERVREEMAMLTCSRAKEYDQGQMKAALDQLAQRVEDSVSQLGRLAEAERARAEQSQPPKKSRHLRGLPSFDV